MNNKKKLALLSLVAVPSLLYSAPASAADVTGHTNMAYIYNTSYYNANVSNVVQMINNINFREFFVRYCKGMPPASGRL